MKEFSYLGTALTNGNSIHEVIKSTMKSRNAFCLSVQNLFSSSLLSKNIKIKVCRTIIVPVVLYGCETWSLPLTEEQRLRVFENRLLRRIFGPKRAEVTREWRRLRNEELNAVYSSSNIIWVIKSTRMRWAGHIPRMGKSEMHTGFWWGYLREGDHLGEPGVDWSIILKWISKTWDGGHGLD
jgi:hypothetical protein